MTELDAFDFIGPQPIIDINKDVDMKGSQLLGPQSFESGRIIAHNHDLLLLTR
jgi:hypothetical protein